MTDGFDLFQNPQDEFGDGATVIAGDLAVNQGSWSMTGTGPDGETLSMQGNGYDVMRKQTDGSWKMVIDAPWGNTASN